MNDADIRRIKRESRVERGLGPIPSQTRRARRKAKLKMRFKDRLDLEIADTVEKLELLREVKAEAKTGS